MSRRSFSLLATALATTAALAACSTPRQFNTVNPNLSSANAQFGRQSATTHEIVKIRWNSLTELQTLSTSGLDILRANPDAREIEVRATTAELTALEKDGVAIQRSFSAQAAQTRQSFPSGYMTYEQMTQRIKALVAKYPQLAKLEDVGDTVNKQRGSANHEIWAVHLGANQNPSKTNYLFIGGVHARELAPVEVLMNLMNYLTENYGKDSRVTQIMNNSNLTIMPMVNVDGRVMVEEGSAWQRKNAAGVDLNRNFDNHWNFEGLDVPSSWLRGVKDPGSQIYSGPRPASEPETQAVQAMFHRLKPAVAVDMHAHGEMMLWPLGYSYEDNPHTPVFQALYDRTFKQLGFKGGTSAQILYPTTATTRDYAYEQHKAISMTLEVGTSFRPSHTQVGRIWDELRPHLLTLLETPPIR